ncbi:MAG: DsbA family protein [Thermoanaerobaculia bacterium]
MKRLALLSILIALTSTASAQARSEADLVLDLFMPQCAAPQVTKEPFTGKLPAGMTGEVLSVDSEDHSCHFDGVRITTADGRHWVGSPWPLSSMTGKPEEKIRQIAWNALQLSVVVEPGPVEFGLQRVRVNHVTEAGRIPVDGLVDPAGTMFFPGDFAKNAQEMKSKLDARLAKVVASSPARGPEGAPVTIVEFSDFQCPSCSRASEQFEPFFAKHADRIRYVRIDMPIVSSHPWAFAASAIGRAIWRQNPDAFWKYKQAVYANQSDLSAFTIDQFGRGFAEDNGLDMKKFDSDIASESVRKDLLDALGTAFTNQIAATPTFIVNGKNVSFGVDGEYLKSHVESLLAGK